MDALPYSLPRESTDADARAPRRFGRFARFIAALKVTRRRQAHREIRRHAHLLPYGLDERGNPAVNDVAVHDPANYR